MIYRHCPRCRLAIRCRASYLTLTNCPRCLARAGLTSPMFSSPLSALELRAAEVNPLAERVDPSTRTDAAIHHAG